MKHQLALRQSAVPSPMIEELTIEKLFNEVDEHLPTVKNLLNRRVMETLSAVVQKKIQDEKTTFMDSLMKNSGEMIVQYKGFFESLKADETQPDPLQFCTRAILRIETLGNSTLKGVLYTEIQIVSAQIKNELVNERKRTIEANRQMNIEGRENFTVKTLEAFAFSLCLNVFSGLAGSRGPVPPYALFFMAVVAASNYLSTDYRSAREFKDGLVRTGDRLINNGTLMYAYNTMGRLLSYTAVGVANQANALMDKHPMQPRDQVQVLPSHVKIKQLN